MGNYPKRRTMRSSALSSHMHTTKVRKPIWDTWFLKHTMFKLNQNFEGSRPPNSTQKDISCTSFSLLKHISTKSELVDSRSRAYGRTSAVATAAGKSPDEARPPGIANHSPATVSELAVSSNEDGPFWSRGKGATSADDTAAAVAKLVDEGRPSGIAKCKAT